ncbi:MAG: group I intron-associated PD-(D/E)XK endonuclease [Candidatus Sulfotelmatobacter sp.]
MPKFRTFKERGEWVEAQFIAEALGRGFTVLKPWGDSQPFDVAINFGNRIVRVQVKSTSCLAGTGYRCEFERSSRSSPYTLKQVDFFAVCVIPRNAWYLIPAWALVNGDQLKKVSMLYPLQRTNANRYHYECYREAWRLLRPKPEKKKPRSP